MNTKLISANILLVYLFWRNNTKHTEKTTQCSKIFTLKINKFSRCPKFPVWNIVGVPRKTILQNPKTSQMTHKLNVRQLRRLRRTSMIWLSCDLRICCILTKKSVVLFIWSYLRNSDSRPLTRSSIRANTLKNTRLAKIRTHHFRMLNKFVRQLISHTSCVWTYIVDTSPAYDWYWPFIK